MTTVCLTPTIKRHLLGLATARQAHKVASTSRKRDAGWSDLALHYLGIKGEYVVARASGYPFTDAAYGAHGDDGVDVRIESIPCAIKTRHLSRGDHVVERVSDLARVSHVIFVRGACTKQACLCRTLDVETPEVWTYCGWLTVDEFWSSCTKDDWGHGPRWWVAQPQLHTEVLRDVTCPHCGTLSCEHIR